MDKEHRGRGKEAYARRHVQGGVCKDVCLGQAKEEVELAHSGPEDFECESRVLLHLMKVAPSYDHKDYRMACVYNRLPLVLRAA